MAYLQIDLWPVGWVITVTVAIIVGLRGLERRAGVRARTFTRAALERALDGPTEE
jgi:hypothetical protein